MGERPNHVIVLGAGASSESGYPLATELRLLLASPLHLEKVLNERKSDFIKVRQIKGVAEEFKDSIELFRRGAFGSVDEFARLAWNGKHNVHVQNMKAMVRVVLAALNPEPFFEKSDYYGFVQNLYEEDLFTLKKHVTVISFNYDCHLDYVLRNSFFERQKLSPNKPDSSTFMKNRLSSGFFDEKDLDWAKQRGGFNYFKPHGSITTPDDRYFDYDAIFNDDLKKWAEAPISSVAQAPIIFPWEVFNNQGGFVKEGEFLSSHHHGFASKEEKSNFFQLYKAIWDGCSEAITNAEKISFIGLSMHFYLYDAIRQLFRRRIDRGKHSCSIVNVNHDCSGGDHGPTSWDRFTGFLKRIKESRQDKPEILFTLSNDYSSFKDFIQREPI